MNGMKKLTRIMMLFALTAFAVSCDDNEDLFNEIIGDEDIELMVTDKTSKSVTVYVNELEAGATSFNALVDFTSTDETMRRLYITENYFGAGDEPYDLTASAGFTGLDTKLDGSIDLERDYKAGFSFDIPFKVYDNGTTGEVVYTLWATSGRGDFRDTDKRLTVGLGTIIVNYGGNNPATDIKKFETTFTLDAPLADGSSETFVSLLDGQEYRIDQGAEFAAFWDFGYYYGASGQIANHAASLASTSTYEETFQVTDGTSIVDVDGIAGTTELNDCFFALSSTFTAADFDGITKSSELSGIATPTTQSINSLQVDDVIEFVDNYGKAGLIKVTEIYLGADGLGYTSDAYMTIEIIVQP